LNHDKKNTSVVNPSETRRKNVKERTDISDGSEEHFKQKTFVLFPSGRSVVRGWLVKGVQKICRRMGLAFVSVNV
jgi:hypothetical protein